MNQRTTFQKGLLSVATFVSGCFVAGQFYLLSTLEKQIESVSQWHFPLVERMAISLRLSRNMDRMAASLIEHPRQSDDWEEYLVIRDALVANLTETRDLLTQARILPEALEHLQRQKLSDLEKPLLNWILAGDYKAAAALLNTGEYVELSQELMGSLQDVAERLGNERDRILAQQRARIQLGESSLALVFFVLIVLWAWAFFELQFTRRKIEEERGRRLHSARLAALGEMAGGIAHEINSPLAVIHGKAGLLKKAIERGELEPKQFMEGLSLIERTVDRIAKIVRGLRLYTREGSRDPMDDCPIQQILQDTSELCINRIKSREIEFTVPELPYEVTVHCRPVQISQVFLNLLNNAIDAVTGTPDPWIRMEYVDQGDWIEISVVDSGPGVRPEIAHKVMQPFFTTKEAGRGSGLGLSIANSIIKEHQGILFLDRKSKNTRFVVRLLKHPRVKERGKLFRRMWSRAREVSRFLEPR